eukprot:2131649-Ditylum_brightwellii.AAC.2
MKINAESLQFANGSVKNKTLFSPFYVQDSDKKLSPSDYQTYKLRTNWKDKKSAVYNLVVKYYEVGTTEEWLQFMEAIAHVNDYLVHFPALDRVTTIKISREEFVDILEDGILYQWKLEFERERFDSSLAILK